MDHVGAHRCTKWSQRGPRKYTKSPQSRTESNTDNTNMNKKKAAKRPQSGDDLEEADSKIDKTAAEWRRYHARSPQPVNKNGPAIEWSSNGAQVARRTRRYIHKSRMEED